MYRIQPAGGPHTVGTGVRVAVWIETWVGVRVSSRVSVMVAVGKGGTYKIVSGTKPGDSIQFFAINSSREIPRSSAMASRRSSSVNIMVSHPNGKGQRGVGTDVGVFTIIGVGVKVGSPGWTVGTGEGVSVGVAGREAVPVRPSANANHTLPIMITKEIRPAKTPAMIWRRLDMG